MSAPISPKVISRWWIAGMAAVVAFASILLLTGIGVAFGLLTAPADGGAGTERQWTLVAFLVLGVLAPILVYGPALAALLAGGGAPLVRQGVPSWRLALLLALAAWVAVLVPAVQSITYIQDTMNGVEAGGRSVLELDAWRQTWPLAPITLLTSAVGAWKVASMALAIPMLSLRRWTEPIEIGARSTLS